MDPSGKPDGSFYVLIINMFENLKFPIPLEESRFDEWLVQGRASKIRYNYMVVLWDDSEKDYRPVYLVERADLERYVNDTNNVSSVPVAGYDIYSESKIM